MQQAVAATIAVLEAVAGRIREMDGLVGGIAAAVHGTGEGQRPGLSQLAEVLRGEVRRFVGVIREG